MKAKPTPLFLAAIYEGDITNWEELGGPDEEIYVLARNVGSGTRDTFNEIVMGDDEAETSGVKTLVGSNAEMKSAVVNSDQAIGYLGLGYVQEGDLGVLALDGIEPIRRDHTGRHLSAGKIALHVHLRRAR